MKNIIKNILKTREKTIPILSFPSTQLLEITVNDLINNAKNQASGMKAIADRCEIGASLNMMDLSVEAEAFGATIHFSDEEIPTVTKGIINDIAEASTVSVPEIGTARTKIYIDGIKEAKKIITDIPVFCGVIGPYSLAGRLFDMTELMYSCYDDPENVEVLLSKCSEFIENYINAFKAAGADGVILAEPAAGLLSPELNEQFSIPFVKKIIDNASDDNFAFCYHNCGGSVVDMADSLAGLKADMYHFGNAIDLSEIIPLMPKESVVMGNVDPVLFRNSTPEKIKDSVNLLCNKCASFENFMVSSGCDIPADANWENIDAYFDAVSKFFA